MSKAASLIKKIVTVILGILGIGTITSCYGILLNENENYGRNDFSGTVYIEVTDEETGTTWKEPYNGVKVTLKSRDNDWQVYDEDTTASYADGDGYYRVYTYEEGERAVLVFEPYEDDEHKSRDIEEFGGYYKTKKIPVMLEYFEGNYDVHSTTVDVVLDWTEVTSNTGQ